MNQKRAMCDEKNEKDDLGITMDINRARVNAVLTLLSVCVT